MSSSSKLKVLLDSTYLLPILGIKVEGTDEALVTLNKLWKSRILEVYYTPFSILEILGKISRVKYDRNIVRTGLSLINEKFKLIHPTTEGYMKALELRSKGFKDLIDLLLYVTSLTQRVKFLTRDDALINFLENQGEELGNIVHERVFIERYGAEKGISDHHG